MRFSKKFFLLCFLFPVCAGYSQGKVLDSLKTVLRNPKIHDTVRLQTIARIMDNSALYGEVHMTYNDSLLPVATKGLKVMAIKNSSGREMKVYEYYMGVYFYNKAKMLTQTANPMAVTYFNKAIDNFNSVKDYTRVHTAIVSKGSYYVLIKEFDKAFECYFKGLKYYESTKDTKGISSVNQELGAAYHFQQNEALAIPYFKKALQYYSRPNSELSVGDRSEKATILSNIGTSNLSLRNFAESEAYFKRALEIARLNDDLFIQTMLYGKLTMANFNLNRVDLAKAYSRKARDLAPNAFAKSYALFETGKMYFRLKEYGKAEKYLLESLALAKSVNNLQIQDMATPILYKIYKDSKQFDKSLKMYEDYITIKDSNNYEASRNEMIQQQLKYNYEKKELQAKLAQEKKLSAVNMASEKAAARRNIIIYIFIMIFIILAVSILYGYKLFRQRSIINANKTNELKQKLLLSQMNPHFIFNSVDNIQSLIHKKQDAEAITYLTRFSKLTRQILENSRENFILLSEEIGMLGNYLSIQKLLYNNNFTYNIKVDDDISLEAILVPPMLTQPFIENAIKHGLKNKAEGGVINIHYYIKDDLLFFEVIDNGSGLAAGDTDKKQKSLSTLITKERLDSIATKKDIMIRTVEILDANNIVLGVKTFFEIPYVHNH